MALANDNPIGRDPSILRVAGDTRANVAPGLLTFHTLFVKEHNRLCDEYRKKHPQVSFDVEFLRGKGLLREETFAFFAFLPKFCETLFRSLYCLKQLFRTMLLTSMRIEVSEEPLKS